MKTALELVTVTALMLAADVACGKTEDKAKVSETTVTSAGAAAKASCNLLSELGTCNEYRNGTSLGLEKSLCESFKGKFASAGCSTDGQIGSCAMTDGEIKRYYGPKAAGDHALTIAEAKRDCESELVKGKFTLDPSASSAAAAPPENPKPEPVSKPAAKAAKPAVKSRK